MTKKILVGSSPTSLPIVSLPDISPLTSSMLAQLTSALGVSRDVLPTDDQIEHAWLQIPRLIKRIPPALRDERIVKMCVAIASGLFDAAINYVWNASIVELREKVRRFGIAVVPQVLDDKSFDENSLLELKDAELLDLCLKLNLVGDDDFFFLDQCRATRNSFSAAHPAEGIVDEDEFLAFLSRCQKHALSSTRNPKGVDTRVMLEALKAARFKMEQRQEWERRVRETFDAQRELIFVMLHGIYCDPASGEEARLNALSICKAFSDEFSPKTRSALVDRHQEYKAKGDEARQKASLRFFEGLGQFALLSKAEVHSIFTTASRNLLGAHNGWDNFHNEPPFAERIARLSRKNHVPETAQPVFVEAVVTAATGNAYGVSHAAAHYYREMVESFSPNEVKLMLEMANGTTLVASRLKSSNECARRFRDLVALVDAQSVPTASKSLYKKLLPVT
jgi:hypothetical protein